MPDLKFSNHPKSSSTIETWRQEVAGASSTPKTNLTNPNSAALETRPATRSDISIEAPVQKRSLFKKLLPRRLLKMGTAREEGDRTDMYTEKNEEQGDQGGVGREEEERDNSMDLVGGSVSESESDHGVSGVGLKQRRERLERAARLLKASNDSPRKKGGGVGIC